MARSSRIGDPAGRTVQRAGRLLLVAALLAGCGASDDAPSPITQETDPPATDDGDDASSEDPDGQDPSSDGDGEMTDTRLDHELTFEQYGGWIPGGVQELTIAPDGTAVLTTGSADILEPVTYRLSEEELTQLSSILGSGAVEDQAGSPPSEAEDETVFDITYGSASVTSTQQGADGDLRELFDVLEAIILRAPDDD